MVDIQTRHTHRRTDEGPTSTSPWRRPAFLGSAVVVVLVLAVGSIVVVTNLMRNDSSPVAPSATAAASSAPPTTRGPQFTPSVCGLPGVETRGTVSQAPDATWTLVGTTAAPTSGSSGPGIVDGDSFRRCFAHTPTGSVFAAANFTAMGSVATLDRKIAEYSIAKGPGREQLLAASSQSPNGGVRIQINGFRVLSYTGEAATVDIAMRTSQGALAGQVYDLIWEDGDWKARVTDQGELLTQIVQLPDLQGYIPWAGA